MNIEESKKLNKLITITCYVYIALAVVLLIILLAYIGHKIDGGLCYENSIKINQFENITSI